MWIAYFDPAKSLLKFGTIDAILDLHATPGVQIAALEERDERVETEWIG
jgi:hypothetical protein